jgi:hypothetical protein
MAASAVPFETPPFRGNSPPAIVTRSALSADRCPTGVSSLAELAGSVANRPRHGRPEAARKVDSGERDRCDGDAHGMGF